MKYCDEIFIHYSLGYRMVHKEETVFFSVFRTLSLPTLVSSFCESHELEFVGETELRFFFGSRLFRLANLDGNM